MWASCLVNSSGDYTWHHVFSLKHHLGRNLGHVPLNNTLQHIRQAILRCMHTGISYNWAHRILMYCVSYDAELDRTRRDSIEKDYYAPHATYSATYIPAPRHKRDLLTLEHAVYNSWNISRNSESWRLNATHTFECRNRRLTLTACLVAVAESSENLYYPADFSVCLCLTSCLWFGDTVWRLEVFCTVGFVSFK